MVEIDKIRVEKIDAAKGRSTLLAVASVELVDSAGFALGIRNLQYVRLLDGREVLVMPSRKLAFRCGKCSKRNDYDANYCSSCGHLVGNREISPATRVAEDYVVPLNASTRKMLQDRIQYALEKQG